MSISVEQKPLKVAVFCSLEAKQGQWGLFIRNIPGYPAALTWIISFNLKHKHPLPQKDWKRDRRQHRMLVLQNLSCTLKQPASALICGSYATGTVLWGELVAHVGIGRRPAQHAAALWWVKAWAVVGGGPSVLQTGSLCRRREAHQK